MFQDLFNLRADKSSVRRAFTLVELLVVIGIIAVLIGILIPVLSKSRDRANRTACLAHLRSIGQGIIMYADAFKGRLPNGNPPATAFDNTAANFTLSAFAQQMRLSAGVFHCPSDRDPSPEQILTAELNLPNSARTSYDFYSIYWMPELGPRITRIKNAPLAWDLMGGSKNPNEYQNHGKAGGNVVYADGHADWQETRTWDDTNWPSPAAARYQP